MDACLEETGADTPSHDRETVHLSAVLVVTTPEQLERCRLEIERGLGIEVHHRDPASGRLIAVLEARSADALRDAVAALRAVPGVAIAAPVVHTIDGEAGTAGSDPVEVEVP